MTPPIATPPSVAQMTTVQFPGAQAPARDHHLLVGGVSIAVHEWGDQGAPPLFLVHGGFDFARTYAGDAADCDAA